VRPMPGDLIQLGQNLGFILESDGYYCTVLFFIAATPEIEVDLQILGNEVISRQQIASTSRACITPARALARDDVRLRAKGHTR
jgi:hypothetical protein